MLIHKIRTLLSMGESGGVCVCGGGDSRSRRPFSHGKLQVEIGALKILVRTLREAIKPLSSQCTSRGRLLRPSLKYIDDQQKLSGSLPPHDENFWIHPF